MADDANLIGPDDPAFRLELTAAQLKVTHTALKSLFDDLGHEERDVQDVVREVLAKLPGEHDIRAIDLKRELARRREAAAWLELHAALGEEVLDAGRRMGVELRACGELEQSLRLLVELVAAVGEI